MSDIPNRKTGTTTVALKGKDCVVLAADSRGTVGNLIADKAAYKLLRINDTVAATFAGSVSTIQLIDRYLKSELKIRELRTGRQSTVKEVAALMRSMVFHVIRANPMFNVAHFLVGGYDKSGFHLYDVFPDGSLMEMQEYVCSGSGSVFTYGVLEHNYKAEMSNDETVKLAIDAVDAAIQRDNASGNSINALVITQAGIETVPVKLVDTHAR